MVSEAHLHASEQRLRDWEAEMEASERPLQEPVAFLQDDGKTLRDAVSVLEEAETAGDDEHLETTLQDALSSLEEAEAAGSGEAARATQYNNLGRGKGPAGLWSHSDFVKKLPCATGQSSTLEVTLNTRTSRSEKVAGFNHQLLEGMNGINALQLECVTPKSHVKLQKRWLATLDELKKTMFPPRRSQASEVEPLDVKSASCSSVASSVAARELLQFVCDCGSSEEFELCGNPPSCSSLELRSDGSNESVGSTISVAGSGIERPVCANRTLKKDQREVKRAEDVQGF